MGVLCIIVSVLIIFENKKMNNVLGRTVKIGKKSDLKEVQEASLGASKRSFKN
jgi:hypothetical protein